MPATPAPSTPADEVAQVVIDLCALIDGRMAEHPVFVGIYFYISLRLGRLRAHLLRLAARIHAGKPPRSRRAPLTGAAAILAGHKSRRRHRNPIQWPTKFGALAALLSHEATPFVDRLRALLATPDAVAAVVANPELGRYLRALCRTLGLPLIPELRLKRRARARKPKPAPADRTTAPVPAPMPVAPGAPPATSSVHHIIPMAPSFYPSDHDAPTLEERVRRSLARRFRGFSREL